jgi:ferric-dicitrate binding protein FerR (iron transport regulator)
MDYKQEKDHLIIKSLSNKLDEEEQLRLSELLADSDRDRDDYMAYSELWKRSEKLVLSDNIDVDVALAATKGRMNFSPKKQIWMKRLQQIAAILIISFAISSVLHYSTSSGADEAVYQEITTSFGIQTNVTLADGTIVWLNSDSKLRFPISFTDMKQRRVELSGEAFFEVAHNAEVPFIVNAAELDVKVLGTSFNVTAWPEYNKLSIALQEGKVSLFNAKSTADKALLTMKPNEVVTFDRESRSLNVAKVNDLERYSEWRDGRLVFLGDDIQTVIQKLDKWYNVETVIADESLKDFHFTATFTKETLNQALSLLCSSSGIGYEILAAEQMPNGSYTKRKVVLSSIK